MKNNCEYFTSTETIESLEESEGVEINNIEKPVDFNSLMTFVNNLKHLYSCQKEETHENLASKLQTALFDYQEKSQSEKIGYLDVIKIYNQTHNSNCKEGSVVADIYLELEGYLITAVKTK